MSRLTSTSSNRLSSSRYLRAASASLSANPRLTRGVVMAGVMLLTVASAHATNNALPWEGGLATLQKSITGPVAGIFSILAICATGALLAMGGELNEITKKGAQVVLAMGLAVGAVNVAPAFSGQLASANGAEITTITASVTAQ